MSRENAKIDFFIQICYTEGMKNAPLPVIMWKTDEDHKHDESSSKNFEFYFQNKKVGKCSVRLYQKACGMLGDYQFFPENWFYKEKTESWELGERAPLKPFLEITNFDFSAFQGQGFGRMALQKMYQLSNELGAEGRISLVALKKETSLYEPALFYEHCGFKGISLGQKGRKYFNPTEKNIKLLFSKGDSARFSAKEVRPKKDPSLVVDSAIGIRMPRVLKEMLDRERN